MHVFSKEDRKIFLLGVNDPYILVSTLYETTYFECVCCMEETVDTSYMSIKEQEEAKKNIKHQDDCPIERYKEIHAIVTSGEPFMFE